MSTTKNINSETNNGEARLRPDVTRDLTARVKEELDKHSAILTAAVDYLTQQPVARTPEGEMTFRSASISGISQEIAHLVSDGMQHVAQKPTRGGYERG